MSQAQEVADLIIDLIMEGRLHPGDSLPAERELATRLGVSRPILREALRALSAVNILETRHGAGTYVTALTPELLIAPLRFVLRVSEGAILNLFQMRRIIEPEAAALAAARITDIELDELDRTMEELEAADENAFPLRDIAFHEWVVERVGNPILTSLVRGMRDLEYRSHRFTARIPTSRGSADVEHRTIHRALKAHDPDRARAAMLVHIARVEESLRRAVDEAADSNEG